ncbi:hypothetical protein [Paenibacillus sp. FSL R7-0273]|uniref:hypothetical protein n=1 Tax=Paenibacillus sp. FSL R7-0273 TaxID=1536772 RepID=UPI0006935973|nr:hypothetical protein [Paenibacillus sp. FSL R7-0273]
MSNKEIEQLNTAMKQTSDKRLYERYLAVRLCFEGHPFEDIGELLSRARSLFIGKPTRPKDSQV